MPPGAHRPSKKHPCTLGLGSDSMLPKTDGKPGRCHQVKKLLLISTAHPKSWSHFASYPAVVAERQRQLVEGGPWVNHPFSLFNLIWCALMLFVNLVFVVGAPLRYSYVLPSDSTDHTPLDYIMLALKLVCLVDVVVKFNTGYKVKSEAYVVLSRRRIAWHYIFSWFLVDAASCVPVAFSVPLFNPGYRYQLFMYLIPCIRCLRVYTAIKDFRVFVKIIQVNYLLRRCLRHAVIFLISVHWCCCLLYVPPVTLFYWTGQMPKGYCRFLVTEEGDLTKSSAVTRYKKAMFISFAAFFGTGYTMFRSTNPDEIIVNAVVILYGQVYMIYTLVLLLRVYFTMFNSTMKYQELMDQLEKYMRHKQFPMQMKNRVRDFYNYRFQERYFKEKVALNCLSERLRNQIFLDTCHKLIDKVALFENLPPSVVGTVLGCLKPEVYLPNDLVIRAGEIGDCMYFIASGTVAVISLKGAEVCHLYDGAHFGEVALLMKDRKRVATVVAIEITQVYRLDSMDFRDFIMTYQELYERLEVLASKRMHETVLIDEAYKHRHTI